MLIRAAAPRTKQAIQNCDGPTCGIFHSRRLAGIGGEGRTPPGAGRRSTSSPAIARASGKGRQRPGISAMSRASCSVASPFLIDASLPASSHGSRPRRASAETMLSDDAPASPAIVENRKPSKSERKGRYPGRKVTGGAANVKHRQPMQTSCPASWPRSACFYRDRRLAGGQQYRSGLFSRLRLLRLFRLAI